MKRREFTARWVIGASVGLGASLNMPTLARAQGAPVEGRDFVRLSTPVPVPAGGKIDVVEFFWYGCPHCYAFEPLLDPWSKRLPADVGFRRLHVSFTALQATHAKIFFALEAMGQWNEGIHRKIFNAIHQQRLRLEKEADIVAFIGQNGVDPAKFADAYKSFGVATKTRQADQLSQAYKIDGVPALGIQGRWFTAPSLAGDRVLGVAEALIQQARKPA